MNELKKFETQQDINLLVGLFQQNGKKVAGVSFLKIDRLNPFQINLNFFTSWTLDSCWLTGSTKWFIIGLKHQVLGSNHMNTDAIKIFYLKDKL